jgi:hypothetical protein
MINSRNSICSCIALSNNQIYTLSQYNPGPQAPELIRAGGGGGAVGTWFNAQQIRNDAPGAFVVSGGGGGGGRGLAGNAGGPTPTPTGAAATPVTFNCVSVTPGTPTPITVASPGGQVNISWNPQ